MARSAEVIGMAAETVAGLVMGSRAAHRPHVVHRIDDVLDQRGKLLRSSTSLMRPRRWVPLPGGTALSLWLALLGSPDHPCALAQLDQVLGIDACGFPVRAAGDQQVDGAR
jgi:hypothetical protein